MAGSTWPCMASRSMSACARLLMSSLVQAKCVNSSTCAGQGPCMLIPTKDACPSGLEARQAGTDTWPSPGACTHPCQLLLGSQPPFEHVLDGLHVMVGHPLHLHASTRLLQTPYSCVQQGLRGAPSMPLPCSLLFWSSGTVVQVETGSCKLQPDSVADPFDFSSRNRMFVSDHACNCPAAPASLPGRPAR